jgi:hypothetical protein
MTRNITSQVVALMATGAPDGLQAIWYSRDSGDEISRLSVIALAVRARNDSRSVPRTAGATARGDIHVAGATELMDRWCCFVENH